MPDMMPDMMLAAGARLHRPDASATLRQWGQL